MSTIYVRPHRPCLRGGFSPDPSMTRKTTGLGINCMPREIVVVETGESRTIPETRTAGAGGGSLDVPRPGLRGCLGAFSET